MSLYGLVLFIHVVAAVCGLGATFALPPLMNLPKTVSQAKFAFSVNEKVEKMAKFGSIGLLVTGLIMGWVHPELFKQIWYITAIALYILVQPIVIAFMPKRMKRQVEILETAEGDELPEEYLSISKELKPFTIILNIIAVVFLLLMTIKPF
jgi:hypothetical protein